MKMSYIDSSNIVFNLNKDCIMQFYCKVYKVPFKNIFFIFHKHSQHDMFGLTCHVSINMRRV